MLNTLRDIGQNLLREFAGVRHRRESLGRGASGDKTYRVDKRAEDIILDGLTRSGEPFTLVSEEAGEVPVNGGGGMLALVDPIDGSNNAVTGVPAYATSIAIAGGGYTLGSMEYAYIVNLVSGEEFWALKGGGAFLNGVRLHAQEDVVIKAVAFETRTPSVDIPKALPLLSMARRTRCLGAVALELCYLASGAFSAFISPSPSRSFDFAAGWLIAREAGGVFTGLSGEDLSDMELKLDRRASFLASANNEIHEKALEALA